MDLRWSGRAFTVGVTGAAPFSYQWQRTFDGLNVSDLSGCTDATLVLTNVQKMDYAYYRVVVTNLDGAATSGWARVELVSLPSFGQPTNWPSVSLGVSLINRVLVSASAPWSYQWRRNSATRPASPSTTSQRAGAAP